MTGVLWAYLYVIVEHYYPASFAVGGTPADLTMPAFVYFSFTVLTTTGFGDLTPLTRQARSLCVVEQITGVLFLAILIARLTVCTCRCGRKAATDAASGATRTGVNRAARTAAPRGQRRSKVGPSNPVFATARGPRLSAPARDDNSIPGNDNRRRPHLVQPQYCRASAPLDGFR
jgi:hypothetical protein